MDNSCNAAQTYVYLFWIYIPTFFNISLLGYLLKHLEISVSVEKCISFAELLHLYCGGAGVESFGGWRLE